MRTPLKILVSLLFGTTALAGTTRTYSGPGTGSAPCNTTLQACLDGSASGDTVELGTATLISEDLTFDKSVTLRSKAGVRAAIGGTAADFKKLTLADATTALEITLSGLDLSTASLYGHFTKTGGHVIGIDHCTVGDEIDLEYSKPITTHLSHDVLVAKGESAGVYLNDSTTTDGTVFTLDATEIYNPNSSSSYDAVYYEETGTGSFSASITNNIVHDMASCGCGGTEVFDFRTTTTGSASYLYVINNTVANILNDGAMLGARAPTAGLLTAYVYNNAVSKIPYNYDFGTANAHLAVHADYNNFYNSTYGYDQDEYTSGNDAHDTAVDPKFINSANHDYRLQSTSPLLNSGLSGYASEKDFYGYTRVTEGSVDKGAIERNADLAVSASANPANPVAGTDVTLTIAVTNVGPYDTNAASASITLPTGLVYKSASVSGGSCGGTSTVLCTLGAIPASGANNVTLIATVQTAGPQTVTANVSGGQWADPDSSDDSTSLVVGGEQGGGSDGGTRADAGTGTDGTSDKGGCGCHAGGVDASAFGLLLLGVLALHRRRV